jgi:transposase
MDKSIVTQISNKYKSVSPLFDERTKRLWAAAESHELGWGGITAVHEATGIHRQSIRNGIQELQSIESVDGNRCRKPGGGRKKNSSKDQTLLSALKVLVESTTLGDPMKPLLWSSKSLRHLASELNPQGHQVSHTTVGVLLEELGYSLQSTRKTRDGETHPDRNSQFEFIKPQKLTPAITKVNCRKVIKSKFRYLMIVYS